MTEVVIEVVTGEAPAAPGDSLVVRVARYAGPPAKREAVVGVAVADPALGEALVAAIAEALGEAVGQALGQGLGQGLGQTAGQPARAAASEPAPPVPTVHVRSRNGLARDAAPASEPELPVPTVRVRSRNGLARDAGRLGGAIAVVPVTARNARHLVALVDGSRAAGAIGVQLVWDGAEPARTAVEHHVFAALERARATPGEPPVVLAASDRPVAALRFLVARRPHAW